MSARWECASVSWGVWVRWECESVNWVYEWVTGWTLTTRHHYPIVNRSQLNTILYITIKDVSLIDLRKVLHGNLKSGEIFTRWFIFWGGSLVGVNFLYGVHMETEYYRQLFGLFVRKGQTTQIGWSLLKTYLVIIIIGKRRFGWCQCKWLSPERNSHCLNIPMRCVYVNSQQVLVLLTLPSKSPNWENVTGVTIPYSDPKVDVGR